MISPILQSDNIDFEFSVLNVTHFNLSSASQFLSTNVIDTKEPI
jgi:hypothetical protein